MKKYITSMPYSNEKLSPFPSVWAKCSGLMFLLILSGLLSGPCFSQDINGERIVVGDGALTVLKFNAEISNAKFGDEKAGFSYQIRDRDNSLVLKTNSDEVVNTNLIVTEGKRTHYFILDYVKDININEVRLSHDFSDLKKLKKLVKDAESRPKEEVSKPKEEEKKVEEVKVEEKKEETKKEEIKDDKATREAAEKERKRAEEAAEKERKRIEEAEKVSKREQKELERKAELEANYRKTISDAHKAFDAELYDVARQGYQKALTFKPTDLIAKDKIEEIDDLLARKKLESQKADQALIAGKNYAAALAAADKAIGKEDYEAAQKEYETALEWKPGDKYAQDKLNSVKKRIAIQESEAVARREAASKQKAINDQYQAHITKGDQALKAGRYTDAKAAYFDALALKPDEEYAKTKLKEIDEISTSLAAQKSREESEKARLEKQKLQEQQYKDLIEKADDAMSGKTYAKAKDYYFEAISLKPDETYPKERINRINKIMADQAEAAEAERRKTLKQAEINQKYDALIASADLAFKTKKYDLAKKDYYSAIGLKANESYPKQQLEAIDQALAQMLAEQNRLAEERARIARENQLNLQYKTVIAKADKAFTAKQYEAAKAAYYEAVSLKPDETYPKDKLAQIDQAIADLAVAKAKAAEEKAIREKLMLIEAQYKKAIEKGDRSLAAKKYEDAKDGYFEALGIKPDAEYPKTKLNSVEKILDDIAQKERAEKERLAKLAEIAEQKRLEEMDPVQKVNLPYNQATLYKKYPKINFFSIPLGQRTTADYYMAADTLENHLVSKKVLAVKPHQNLVDSTDSIKLTIQGIGFSGVNGYIKLRLQNNSKSDFLVGPMLLNWHRDDSTVIRIYAAYTSFPVVLPGKEISFVYACRAINATDDQYFTFQMGDRLRTVDLQIKIPGSVYNEEMRREPIPTQKPVVVSLDEETEDTK